MNRANNKVRLSQVDNFFIAYQERSGLLMQLGSETDLSGQLRREDFVNMISSITARWPQLGQRVRKEVTGLFWDGITRCDEMLHYTTDQSVMEQWRNLPIDPFHEPPLQILWVDRGNEHTLVFRAHHCVMDGEAFLKMCIEAAKALSLSRRGGSPVLPQQTGYAGMTWSELWGKGRFTDLLNYVRWLSAESRSTNKASTFQRQCIPGDIGICECRFKPEQIVELKKFSAAHGCSLMWICAAAWIKSLHRWNLLNGTDQASFLTLEFPVSIRRSAATRNSIGNLISPLTLRADARQPIENIAQELQLQTLEGIRKRLHFGVPLFSLPGKYLPWRVFRRVAVNQTTSGFATSHFSWFEYKEDPMNLFSDNSEGLLQLITQRIYTPVCLLMGAALSALISPQDPKLFITFRKTGFSNEDMVVISDFLTQGLLSLLSNQNTVLP